MIKFTKQGQALTKITIVEKRNNNWLFLLLFYSQQGYVIQLAGRLSSLILLDTGLDGKTYLNSQFSSARASPTQVLILQVILYMC